MTSKTLPSYQHARTEYTDTQLSGTDIYRQNGYILRPRTVPCGCDQAIRSMSIGFITSSPEKVIGEGETIHKVWISIRVGREGSRYEEVDRWKVMECKQSVRQLLDIQRDGGQERRRAIRSTTGPSIEWKDTRQCKRK